MNGVGIHPEFRRKGLGRLLMTASLVRAARNKIAAVILEVDIENHRAIASTSNLDSRREEGQSVMFGMATRDQISSRDLLYSKCHNQQAQGYRDHLKMGIC